VLAQSPDLRMLVAKEIEFTVEQVLLLASSCKKLELLRLDDCSEDGSVLSFFN
jgi:hypothetical protein